MLPKHVDVLIWAGIKPIKHGSFEDYLAALGRQCISNGLRVHLVMETPIAEAAATAFDESGLSYELLSGKEVWSSLWLLIRYLRRFRPRVLHFHFFGIGNILIPIARAVFRGGIIVHDHSSRELMQKSLQGRGFFVGAARRIRNIAILAMIDRIIAVSKYVADCIREETAIPIRKISIVYNGVDTNRFHVVRETIEKAALKNRFLGPVNSEVPLILFVGALELVKGVQIFLDIADRVHGAGFAAHFVIAGTGSLQAMVEKHCRSGSKQSIHYIGMRDDIDCLLRASDIFVAPYQWGEAFGLTLAEASASGIPVVASKVGGIPEVVIDGETGLLVRADDSAAFAQAIAHLLENPNLRTRMSKTARKLAVEKFSLQRCAQNTIDVYYELFQHQLPQEVQ